MKKLFTCLAVVLFGAAMWSCSPYDDEELREAVDDLNDRVEAMEEAVRHANSGIETLRKLLDAGRYGIGGETYVPGSTVEGYNEDHDTEFEEEDVEFHL